TLDTIAEAGDSILLAHREEEPPFVFQNRDLDLHIIVISPIGTIIDSENINLSDTGSRKMYSFPILPSLYSGAYIFQIDGDISSRNRVFIKTEKRLINYMLFYYGVNFQNPNLVPLNNFEIDIMIPPNIAPYQRITQLDCNYKPSQLIIDKESNKWLRFCFPQIKSKEEIRIGYRALIFSRLVAFDMTRILTYEEEEEETRMRTSYPEILLQYTKSEPFIESNNKKIIQLASKYLEHPPISRALTYLRLVQKILTYRTLNGDFGAVFAFDNRYGDCTEFASLFVSLCRASKIPARLTTSFIKNEKDEWEYHAQAEFFANGLWFPIDPTLQQETRYLMRNPNCITLQRGNNLGESQIKEIRYRYDGIDNHKIKVRTYKEIFSEKDGNKISELLNQKSYTPNTQTSFFSAFLWKYSIPTNELEKQNKEIEIKVVCPDVVPSQKPITIPVYLYNRNNDSVSGALIISFVKGGVYINHLFPILIEENSNEPIMVEIPATNFIGETVIEFAFQDALNEKIGFAQRKVTFQ
ncbi:MAG: transglutaminase domain-containing protein, partial [Candidatus Heimdallarchaeota archaeon]|nr:transglutaminase domain-containing protein [Candidatus Heimdallarchaeota archaeon]